MFPPNILLGYQTVGNQKEAGLDYLEDVAAVPNQTDQWFSLVFHCLDKPQQQVTLEKERSCIILCIVFTEIPSCSEIIL